MIETIVVIVVALCLIGTVVWAAERYIKIKEPFDWVKGLIIFVMIAVACGVVWHYFVSHIHGAGSLKF